MTGTAPIAAVIPHRPPALLVDRVVEVEPGRRLVAHKAVSLAEACYREVPAHAAEEEYAYPLGRLLESWAQSAVLLACWEKPNPDVLAGQVALLAGVRGARSLAPVLPGSVLVHEVEMVRDLGDTVIVTGRSTVAGAPVLEVGQLTLALRGAEVLAPAHVNTTTPERS
ncbi:3-hydroxyacyl-ACP dehydratase FabZ family protein [Streptomyces sp. NPDC085524]|uniref:3-hydroxyacyl-ACP dehydratase FabZ family protein n=1 Tax=unclassified Streptomyces TaxID=2593676 RepID=UPI0035D75864